jgi:nondiscriminating glutamyl-tRNA synthetase
MSKRHGATSVDQYRQLGYLPEGIDNFLALLGWAPNSEQEIFTMQELVQQFSMEHVAKNPAVFDLDKLNWINGKHMRQLTDDAFIHGGCSPYGKRQAIWMVRKLRTKRNGCAG